ncbi:MAG: phytanoyl-CoA dioxygenase family protein [Minwuia sp.]|uniref:phytanoyl-CoA dioxygenase family protein n=1 Tax=Minwuia sp. TaxID=2493630 RepID=UPI003A865DF4
MSESLPEPTTDLVRAKRDLSDHGYCLVADALEPVLLKETAERLAAQARAEDGMGLSFRDGGVNQKVVDDYGNMLPDAFSSARGGINQRVWNLVNKGRCFRDLVIHPLVDELVGHVLGDAFILSNHSANIARPGGVRMGLHTDQWWMPQPVRADADYVRPADLTRAPSDGFVHPEPSLGIAPPVVCNTMWMLSDFTAANGATEMVPGSHLSGAHPNPGDQSGYRIVQPEAPAGTLLVFDGRLWHGTGANAANSDRVGILVTFCAPQFRQQENQTLAVDPALWDEMPEKLRARLGFRVWNAYGRIELPAEEWVSPTPERIGELG